MPPGPPSPTPEAVYRARLTTLESTDATYRSRQTRLILCLLAAVLPIATLAAAARAHAVPILLPAVAATLSLFLVPPLLKTRRLLNRHLRLLTLYEAAVARLNHQPPESPQTGELFRQPDHLYDRDLNLLGPNSLFSLLATTRTGLGQRALAATLLTPPTDPEARQQAIQELTPNTPLREAIALLGTSIHGPTPPDTFDLWLAQPPAHLPKLLRPILYTTSAVVLALIAAWATHLLPQETVLPNLAAVLALQSALALLYRRPVLPILEATHPLPAQLQILRDGLTLLHTQTFTSPLLQRLQTQVASSTPALAQLHRHLLLVEQRKQEWFYLPFLLLNAGTQAALSLDQWKSTHAPALTQWLEAWATFDALNALATYAFEHPANTYPGVLEATHPATFEATALTHPLLPQAIPNDIALNPGLPFYLISGSNMSGKSTLLRAIGLAVVLARAGAPIPATRARLTPLALAASLALTDSLAEGKSRFLAEVLRLRQILTLARATPTLFLIDELFSGTNSTDRLTAARAVLQALLAANAIGALSTHDLALTTLATENENRHMASPDPTDPLAFDYLLKPGINTATNALAFLRLLNLEDPDLESPLP